MREIYFPINTTMYYFNFYTFSTNLHDICINLLHGILGKYKRSLITVIFRQFAECSIYSTADINYKYGENDFELGFISSGINVSSEPGSE